MKGILLVDKPGGITSHDAVDRIRRVSGTRRVGHTGTLDPAATGLLVLCVGVATRLSEFLTCLDKVYEGAMLLGVETDSYDLDGEVIAERPVPPLDEEALQKALNRYIGDIMQVPPMVSAVKVNGERLYKKARKGETVERTPRPVTVREFVLLRYEPPHAHFRVRCTRGTYARSLCHEVGQELGCGAALASLRRTAVGRHHVDDARPLDAFETPYDVREKLIDMAEVLDLPEAVVRSTAQSAVANGAALLPRDLIAPPQVQEGWVQLKSETGELLAIASVESTALDNISLRPKRVLCERQ